MQGPTGRVSLTASLLDDVPHDIECGKDRGRYRGQQNDARRSVHSLVLLRHEIRERLALVALPSPLAGEGADRSFNSQEWVRVPRPR
jgi:hypothetical protein